MAKRSPRYPSFCLEILPLGMVVSWSMLYVVKCEVEHWIFRFQIFSQAFSPRSSDLPVVFPLDLQIFPWFPAPFSDVSMAFPGHFWDVSPISKGRSNRSVKTSEVHNQANFSWATCAFRHKSCWFFRGSYYQCTINPMYPKKGCINIILAEVL